MQNRAHFVHLRSHVHLVLPATQEFALVTEGPFFGDNLGSHLPSCVALQGNQGFSLTHFIESYHEPFFNATESRLLLHPSCETIEGKNLEAVVCPGRRDSPSMVQLHLSLRIEGQVGEARSQ